MKKKNLGILMCLLFGVFGLLALLCCNTKEEKDEFMSGWLKTFFVCAILIVIIYAISMCSVICTQI